MLAVCLGLYISCASGLYAQSKDAVDDTIRYLKLFSQAIEHVRDEYVTEKSDQELIEAAIAGMLSSLDPYSSYLNAKDFDHMQTDTRGDFGGLGIEVTLDQASKTIRVVSPISDTPADKAGIMSNDLIIEIDGDAVPGMTLDEAVDRMRGPIGESITLTIAREGREPFEVKLVRAKIEVQAVKFRMEGEVGYIRITQFNSYAMRGLKKAIEELNQEANDDVIGYVLDLRNNPGGLLDQAVDISDAFLNKGEIVSTRGRDKFSVQRYQASNGDLAKGKPMVVLINGGSASASEIVAGALHDLDRATIVGTTSFGKGSVQTIIPLKENSAIKLTTQLYYTPNGQSIHGKGIEPDIYVEATQPKEEDENQNNDALPQEQAEEKLENSITEPIDYQLNKALEIIHELSMGRM